MTIIDKKSFEEMSKRRTKSSAPLPFKKEFKKRIVTGYSATNKLSGYVPKGKISNCKLHCTKAWTMPHSTNHASGKIQATNILETMQRIFQQR